MLKASSILFASILFSSLTLPVSAQNFPQRSLDQLLNQVDQNQSWNNVPVSGNTKQVLPGYRGPANASGFNQSPGGFGSNQSVNPGQQFAPIGGMRQPMQSGPSPFSPRGLMRIFFEGGSGGGTPNPGQDNSANGNIEAQLQIARDQAAQAEGDASRASYGSDKWAKQSAASSAQYHANAANAAADNAYSQAYGKSQTAQNYAAQARNAANRAQEAANRARYNADTSN